MDFPRLDEIEAKLETIFAATDNGKNLKAGYHLCGVKSDVEMVAEIRALNDERDRMFETKTTAERVLAGAVSGESGFGGHGTDPTGAGAVGFGRNPLAYTAQALAALQDALDARTTKA